MSAPQLADLEPAFPSLHLRLETTAAGEIEMAIPARGNLSDIRPVTREGENAGIQSRAGALRDGSVGM